jgi:hypothetical protein
MVDLRYIKPADLWYIIGLITTDGNLSSDGRHISITSKDKDLLESVKAGLNLNIKIGKKARGREQKKKYSILQFSDAAFYKYLSSVGLKPKKSLILENIKVPRPYFKDFIRGIVDGDGSINTWINRANLYEQWCLRIFSGAPVFSSWLKEEIEREFRIKGRLYSYISKDKKNPIFILKFGKLAAKVILEECYYKDCLALNRKFKIARKCLKSENRLSKYGNVISV